MKCSTDHLKNNKTKNYLVSFMKNITFITPPPTTALMCRQTKLCWPSMSRVLVFPLWCCVFFTSCPSTSDERGSVTLWFSSIHSCAWRQICGSKNRRTSEHVRACQALNSGPSQLKVQSSDVGGFVSSAHSPTLHISKFSSGLSSVSTDCQSQSPGIL